MRNLSYALILLAAALASPGYAAKLPPSNSCTANVSPGRVDLSWIKVPDAESYAITRDGAFLGTAPAFPTVWVDYPPAGAHRYCIVAQAAGYEPSDPCCVNASTVYPPGNLGCYASTDLIGKIVFQWDDVEGETGYVVTRDGSVVYHALANETRFVDNGYLGQANYCVRAINPFGSSEPCCATGYGATAIDGKWRLSWGTCEPQVANQDFLGPHLYTLVLSVAGMTQANVAHDTEICIRPEVPDAWRFDSDGCQSWGGLNVLKTGLPSCAPMVGAHPLSISSYHLNSSGDGSAVLRLAISYEPFVPDPSKRYLLWKIVFNHAYSVAGEDSDPETCDGADRTLEFSALPSFLLADNTNPIAVREPLDMPVQWNGDVPVRSFPTTWGRVKGLYR